MARVAAPYVHPSLAGDCGRRKENGGALIVVRIVLSSGFDPADYSVFQALFGMDLHPPSSRSDKRFTVHAAA
jgi:hypothetical protein